jgi:colanic acid biosynthesis glycosyl transferase WcaI
VKILIWSPNYAPELVGIPPLVTSAAEWLAQKGHEVDVVTALPNYPDRRIFDGWGGRVWRTDTENGVRVRRSWLRVRPAESFTDKALYEASFAVTSVPRVLARIRNADALLCTVPTLLSAAQGMQLARITRTRSTLWVQDLVLSAALAVDGVGSTQRRVLGAMRAIESRTARSATRIVSCSSGFVPHLLELGVTGERVQTIPNWVDTREIVRLPEPAGDGEISFLYTGNLGYTQGFETLFEAAATAGDRLKLIVAGSGNAVDQVARLVSPPHELRQLAPRERYPALLGSAHVLVVIQRAVAANANLPSKIASYLAAGRPIVASIGLDTPAAELLRASGAAILVPPEQPPALAEAMRSLRDDPILRERLGGAGRDYAVAHLDRDVVLPRLERAVLGLTDYGSSGA